MSEVNVPLLRKAVEWVEEQDALMQAGQRCHWYQGAWITTNPYPEGTTEFEIFERRHNVCGTAYCVAGYVGSMVDDRFKTQSAIGVYSKDDSIIEHLNDDMADAVKEGVAYSGASAVSVREVARHELGLDDIQASQLFAGENNAPTIRMLAEHFAGEAL